MLQQKRSELLRLLFIVALLALTVGIIFVYSAKVDSSSQTTVPKFVKGSNDTTFNFSISVAADSNAVKRVDVNRPSAFTVVNCPVNLPAAWTCTKDNADLLRFQETVTGITAGNTVSFSVNTTASGTSGNVSWSVDTYETSGASNLNSSKFNVTIDADAPLMYNGSMNLSDGNVTLLNSSSLAWPGGWVKLQDLTFNITITDLVYDNKVNVSIYYNVSNTTVPQAPITIFPHPNTPGSYSDAIRLTSQDPATGRYNGTIPASAIYNGTIVTFTIVANDSVGNVNISNLTTNTYNFTVDGSAPLLKTAPNITDEFDARNDRILTSTALVNITINVTDDGSSGVSRVDINASATTGWVNMTQNTSRVWYYSGSLASLGVPAGDQNLTLYFRAFDNVSNVNGSIATLNVLVDDYAPQFAIGLFFPANITEGVSRQNFTTSNTSVINFSILIYGSLNYTGSTYANSTVATIMGPDGRVYNLSLLSKTSTWGTIGRTDQMVYSSLWYSAQSPQSGGAPESSLNSTNSTLVTLGCGQINVDGGVCPILINVTDIFGRSNSTNISITFDNVSAHVVNISNNATSSAVRVVRGGSIINFSLNANNNIQNVTIHNASTSAQIDNATAVTDFGTSNYSIALSANQLCSTGIEGTCTVNFSTVDKAFNINRSGIAGAKAQGASTTFIVDNSAPLVSNFLVNGTLAGPNVIPGTGSVRVFRSDLALNMTFNVSDQVTNVTQANIGNATLRNATIFADGADGYNNVSTLASFGCTAGVEADCVLRVHASDNESIDSLRNSNTTVNLTFRVDDLTPRVANFTTNLTYNHRVTATGTLINFTVNVTDANIVNVSVANTTVILMNRSSASTTSNSTSVVWTVATNWTALGCSGSSGNCTVTVYANDSAGNVNASQWLSVNLDSSAISTVGMNLSLGEYTTGSTTNDSTPTLWLNLTTNSLCRYSTPNAVPYASMTAMGGDGTPAHSVTLSALSDGTYNYYFRCVDNLNVEPSNFLPSLTFTVSATPTTVVIESLTTRVVVNGTATAGVFIAPKPTVHANTSDNANCRYSTGSVTNYSAMSTQFTSQGTRNNSFTLLGDAIDGDYDYRVSCVNTLGGDASRGDILTFRIDTRSLWNITIGESGSLSVANDYFTQASRFYTFRLPKNNILSTTAHGNTTYNVSNVLASVVSANPSGSTNNMSILYAYDRAANTWTSYVPGRAAGNDFNNFTTDTKDYYVNFTVANERIEIN